MHPDPRRTRTNTEQLQARLQRMPPLQRTHTLELPLHLDQAGDPESARRLIQLVRDGFPRLKSARMLDSPRSELDYRFYFRATLRAADLAAALEIARSRAGLSHFTAWLASGVLAGVLPRLDPQSSLWQRTQRAVASLENETLRVERLTEFHRAGLRPEMYAWLRHEFDANASAARDDARTAFLANVAAHEPQRIDYILERMSLSKPTAPFGQAMVVHLERLCSGTSVTTERALAAIAKHLLDDDTSFRAAVEALASLPNRALATQGLEAFEAALPGTDQAPLDAMLLAAGVARAWFRQEEPTRAERQALRCMTLAPPPAPDDTMLMLYASKFIEASCELLRAVAPFHAHWPQARKLAEELAARASGWMYGAQTLAGLVRVTPSIAEPTLRIAWLREHLHKIDKFLEQDFEVESKDLLDMSFNLANAFDEKSTRESLCDTIAKGMGDLLENIDAVLDSADDVEPLVEIVKTLIAMQSGATQNTDSAIELIRQMFRAAARSHSVHVRVLILESILNCRGIPIDDAAQLLGEALPGLVSGMDEDMALAMVSRCFEHIEGAWTKPGTYEHAVAIILLIASISASRDRVLFLAFQARMDGWVQQVGRRWIPDLNLHWAAVLVSHGDVEGGKRLLESLKSAHRTDRLNIAGVLLRANARDEVAALLKADLQDHVTFDDPSDLRESLEVARLLTLAGNDSRARKLLLTAATDYRNHVGKADKSVEATLCTIFSSLNDERILDGLLAQAEGELLESGQDDAAMAAGWLATLALCVIDEIELAKSSWARLHEWQAQRRKMVVRDCFVAVLDDLTSEAALARLINEIEAIGPYRRVSKGPLPNRRLDQNRAEEELLRACRLIPLLPSRNRLTLIQGILDLGASPSVGSQAAARIARALCDVLVANAEGTGDAQYVAQRFTSQLTDAPSASNRDADDLIGPLFKLMRAFGFELPSDSSALFERIVTPRKGSSFSQSGPDEGLFEEALKLGANPDAGIKAAANAPLLQQRRLLGIVIRGAAATQEITALNAALEKVLGLGEESGPEYATWLSATYAICEPLASPELIRILEGRLRSFAPLPFETPLVEWALNLANTRLSDLIDEPMNALEQNLDKFAAHPRALEWLASFLKWKMSRDPDSIGALLDRVSQWAMHMPPVTHEDWRHSGFASILDASGDAPPYLRAQIQQQVLERAMTSMQGASFVLKTFVQRLVKYPLDCETAARALRRWLEVTGVAPESVLTELTNLLLENLLYDSEHANAEVVAAFLSMLPDGHPDKFERAKAAGVVCASHESGLRTRFAPMLLHDYATRGVAALSASDLDFLADQPLEWWMERSPAITLESADSQRLIHWVTRVTRQSPSSAWWAVILATEWLSRTDPRGVPDFWLELCLLPAWFHDETRRTVLMHWARHAQAA